MADKTGNANTGSDEKTDRPLSTQRVTRQEALELEKKKFLEMPLKEKRKQYQCGDKYSTLNDVPKWNEYFLQNQARLLSQWKGKKLETPYTASNEINSKVAIWRGDITRIEIDAIVNAANNSLLGGGGVDGAIHRAAGKLLVKECMGLNGCDSGEAKITGGYKLPAKYVIHTVGPIGEKPWVLENAYKKSLLLVKEGNLKSVAFPCISTGIYGYPNVKAAHLAIKTIRQFLEIEEILKNIDCVIFCLFLPVDINIYENLMQLYFPVDGDGTCSTIPPGVKDKESQADEDEKGEKAEGGVNTKAVENEAGERQNGDKDEKLLSTLANGAKLQGETEGDVPEGSVTRVDTQDGNAVETKETREAMSNPRDDAIPSKNVEGKLCVEKAGHELVEEGDTLTSDITMKKKQGVVGIDVKIETEEIEGDSAKEVAGVHVKRMVKSDGAVVEDTKSQVRVDARTERTKADPGDDTLMEHTGKGAQDLVKIEHDLNKGEDDSPQSKKKALAGGTKL